VTKVDGSKGIVDLMLSRAIPCSRDDEIEHLVVELKAPKVKIGTTECNQIEEYAYAVIDDERFSSLTATWNFWILSNEVDPVAKKKSNQDGRARGILAQNSENGVRVTIWVKEWSQIIKENKHRLEFIRDKLNYSVDRQQGIKHLREVYSEFTRGVTVNSESDEVGA
ncbi:type I restriction enzyme HsdR N-terminal domain-containing protein, partial [Alloalcanivorax xenomutans]|uniref:type I restriction enzyme HsdR N-terminal domain-containing protein n=1 Tax=Alloalcanivorax xenomutans TaxID=1094342 RepID=UPI001C6FCC94